MKKIGFIGLGNMGMGMTKNLLSKGYSVKGFDIREEVRNSIKEFGGVPASSIAEATEGADVIFLMVLNGQQVIDVIEGGVKQKVTKGATVIMCPTVGSDYVKQAEALLLPTGAEVLDVPVTGGKGGADSGMLTMMGSGKKSVYDANLEVLQAVGKTIYHVGDEIGQGQVVKACLQAMVGITYQSIFEAMVLGAKAGLDMEMLSNVINNSVIGSGLTRNTTDLIMDRKFKNTGAHIGVTYKDLGISTTLAKGLGVPMLFAGLATEMFRAGLNNFPDEDNWSLIKLYEQNAGTIVKRKEK